MVRYIFLLTIFALTASACGDNASGSSDSGSDSENLLTDNSPDLYYSPAQMRMSYPSEWTVSDENWYRGDMLYPPNETDDTARVWFGEASGACEPTTDLETYVKCYAAAISSAHEGISVEISGPFSTESGLEYFLYTYRTGTDDVYINTGAVVINMVERKQVAAESRFSALEHEHSLYNDMFMEMVNTIRPAN